MSENRSVFPDQPVAQLTVRQLQALITVAVRQAVQEELGYYVNEQGIKIRYTAEEAAPDYLAELQQDYEALQAGGLDLASSEVVLGEA
ncbi:MAG: hypothetical protein JW850_12340 [Thermoflexales bacterium]|nr:hypothetical protein [Thermoflexales bacterium]